MPKNYENLSNNDYGYGSYLSRTYDKYNNDGYNTEEGRTAVQNISIIFDV